MKGAADSWGSGPLHDTPCHPPPLPYTHRHALPSAPAALEHMQAGAASHNQAGPSAEQAGCASAHPTVPAKHTPGGATPAAVPARAVGACHGRTAAGSIATLGAAAKLYMVRATSKHAHLSQNRGPLALSHTRTLPAAACIHWTQNRSHQKPALRGTSAGGCVAPALCTCALRHMDGKHTTTWVASISSHGGQATVTWGKGKASHSKAGIHPITWRRRIPSSGPPYTRGLLPQPDCFSSSNATLAAAHPCSQPPAKATTPLRPCPLIHYINSTLTQTPTYAQLAPTLASLQCPSATGLGTATMGAIAANATQKTLQRSHHPAAAAAVGARL